MGNVQIVDPFGAIDKTVNQFAQSIMDIYIFRGIQYILCRGYDISHF